MDPRQQVQEVCLESVSHGVGRLHPSEQAALTGACRHWPQAAGDVEEVPRYPVLWLLASEIQMGTFPTGRKKARRVRKSCGHACHFY